MERKEKNGKKAPHLLMKSMNKNSSELRLKIIGGQNRLIDDNDGADVCD